MRAGIATIEITPSEAMTMGGFGMRLGLSEGIHDPLLLTALYFGDSGGEAWMLCADLVQFPDGEPFQEGRSLLALRLGCEPCALFFNASHTHGGPEMGLECSIHSEAMEAFHSPENQRKVRAFHQELWERAATACLEARASAFSARLVWGQGTTRFPMNRRRRVGDRIENAPNPEGPIEDRLRLLGIEDDQGTLRALGLILAAHPTTTGPQYQFTADYVGAWRRSFQAAWRGDITPFFLQACGGDARAAYTCAGDHWRTVVLSELPRMGETLTQETLAALDRGLTPLEPAALVGATGTIDLACEPTFTTEADCVRLLSSERSWERDFAKEAIRHFARGESLPSKVTMEIACLRLAKDFLLLGMGSEPLCALGRKIEAAFPGQTAVALGYTNGGSGYLPDDEELRRGGYEAENHFWMLLSGPLSLGAGDRIISVLQKLEAKTRGKSAAPKTMIAA